MRWRVAAGAVLLVLGLAAWFAVFGPPSRWGSGVEDAVPRFEPGALPAELAVYADEAAWEPVRSGVVPVEGTGGVSGRPIHVDVAPQLGLAVLQTHDGPRWIDGQRLYVRSLPSGSWREVGLSAEVIAGEPTVVRHHGRAAVVFTRWRSWWPPHAQYGRFVRSLLEKPLRAEHGIHLLEVEDGVPRFVFPGHILVASPDRSHVAYTTSENGVGGFHGIRVWDVDGGTSTPILSLWEADPGSGISFQYRWSRDGRALLVEGTTQGFERHGPWRPRGLRILYVVATRRLFELPRARLDGEASPQ